MKGLAPLMSSARTGGKEQDCWQTPETVLELVRYVAPITLDPCTSPGNPTGAQRFFTEAHDGLTRDWPAPAGWGLTFINPPYSKMDAWAPRIAEMAGVRRETIALLPARTDTKWWHTLIASRPHRVCFWKGRIKFNRPDGTPGQAAPFPSALLYWGADDATFARVFSERGWVTKA